MTQTRPSSHRGSLLPLLLGAGAIAALVVGVIIARRRQHAPLVTRRRRSFPALRGAILGAPKAMVMEIFGPPPTATHAQSASATTGKQTADFTRSETWYYPLDVVQQTAMAIRFSPNGDRAVQVDRIIAPR